MQIHKSYASSAEDTDAIANNVTASSGAAFTLIVDEMDDDLAHKVIITPSGSVTGNYTITGNDANGVTQTETLATNTTNAVTSVKYYKSALVVTAPAGLGAETVDIGWTAAAITPDVPIHSLALRNPALGISVDVTDTPAYSLQQSYGRDWYNHASIVTKTANADGSLLFPVAALRLIFTAASTVVLHIITTGQ